MKKMLALLLALVLLLSACTMPATKDTDETTVEEVVSEEPVEELVQPEEETELPNEEDDDAFVGIWSSAEGKVTDPAMQYNTFYVALFDNNAAIRFGWNVMELGSWKLNEDGAAEVVFDAGCSRGMDSLWKERTDLQETPAVYVCEDDTLKQPEPASGDFSHDVYYEANRAEVFTQCADQLEAYHEQGMENWQTQYDMNMGSSRCAALWNGLEQVIFKQLLLTEEDVSELEEREKEWQEEKAQQLEQVKSEYEGGTIAALMINEEDMEETKERVSELLAMLGAAAGETGIFAQIPEEFMFYSGVGGWATELTLADDGSFTGRYYDYDLGDTGEEYPNGTGYVCDFVGKFTEPEQISECWYMMELESIAKAREAGQILYEDGYRFVTAEPHGLEDPELFYLYLPGATAEEVASEFMNWYQMGKEPQLPEGCYGIYNLNAVCGFIAREK
ncbi:MAG: hypothetical protein J6J43_08175 [Oscillospiraceae bacterium]|nr:hypothetical protein [Oscillospiraceae bacterium]